MILKKKVTNISLSLIVLLLMGSLVECSARLFLHKLPLKYHEHLNWPLITLAQSSKVGVIPNDYILILGDSYAQGTGDWFLEVDKSKNDAFGSQHLIHQRTGRDVLSFGKGNNSSIYSIAVYPSSWFSFFESSLLYKLPPPKDILVYFYGGNDLDDNVDILYKYYDAYEKNKSFRNPNQFNRFLHRLILKEDKNWTDQFIVLGLFKRLFSSIQFRLLRHPKTLTKNTFFQNEEEVFDEYNKIRVNNEVITIPDEIGPEAMALTAEDTENSFYAFDMALNHLKKRFPQSQISVVYIPSVLESYELSTSKIEIEHEGDKHFFPITDFHNKKKYIYSRIKEITAGKRMRLIDVRPAVREASKTNLLHGTKDWHHFNKEGYGVLADVIIQENVV